VDDTEVINFLLSTEIIPLCLRTMEMGSELSKTVATFIVQKILLDNVSLPPNSAGTISGVEGSRAQGVTHAWKYYLWAMLGHLQNVEGLDHLKAKCAATLGSENQFMTHNHNSTASKTIMLSLNLYNYEYTGFAILLGGQ
jgi:hypothetical protein